MSDCNFPVKYQSTVIVIMWTFWTCAVLLPQVIIQCCQSKRHHGSSYVAVNGCFAPHYFHSVVHFFSTSSPPFMSGLNHRALSQNLWTDQVGTVGWHLLALSRLPRYQAGVEQSLSQKPWRGCSVENRRWSPTAKKQLAGECCHEGESVKCIIIDLGGARNWRLKTYFVLNVFLGN